MSKEQLDMLKNFGIGAVIALVLYFGMAYFQSADKVPAPKDNSLALAGYSFEYGCYTGAKHSCDHLKLESERFTCYDEATKGCPQAAAEFVAWLKAGAKE